MVSYFKTFETTQIDTDEFYKYSLVKGLLLSKASNEQVKEILFKEFDSLSEEEVETLIQFVREHPDRSDW